MLLTLFVVVVLGSCRPFYRASRVQHVYKSGEFGDRCELFYDTLVFQQLLSDITLYNVVLCQVHTREACSLHSPVPACRLRYGCMQPWSMRISIMCPALHLYAGCSMLHDAHMQVASTLHAGFISPCAGRSWIHEDAYHCTLKNTWGLMKCCRHSFCT